MRQAQFRATAAAILGQELQKLVHSLDIDRVDDEPAFPPGIDQTGMAELRQVEGHRGSGNAEPLCDPTGGESFPSMLDQKAEDREACLLGQGSKSENSAF